MAVLFVLAAKLAFFRHLTHERILSLAFLDSCVEVLVLLGLSLLIKRPGLKRAYVLAVEITLSFLFLAHSLHFKHYTEFGTVYEARYAHLLFGPAADSVFALMGTEVLFVADLPLLPFLALGLKNTSYRNELSRANTALYLFLLGMLLCLFPVMMNRSTPDNYLKNVYSREAVVRKFGFINYQILDAYIFLNTELSKEHVKQVDIARVSDWFKVQHSVKKTTNALTGAGKGKNLLVIQVEALENFVIKRSIHGRDITPNLNRLAQHSLYYTNIYDQTGLGGSSDSTFLANCSLYPSKKGAVSFRYFQDHFDSLPKVLEQQGYSTAVMHNYRKEYWNSAQFEKSIGFEHQFYIDTYKLDDIIGWGLSDRSFFTQSVQKIMNLPRPFHVFMRTLSSHQPFNYVTTRDDDFPLGELEGSTLGNYIRSMHYVDTTIGEFMEKLAARGVLSNTVIVIYGDHRASLIGSELAEIGVNEKTEARKIPLIISIPGRQQEDERDTIGGLINVPPTVLNIMGVDTSDLFFMGRDLNEKGNHGFVIFRDDSSKGNPAEPANWQLEISDLIIEKDMIPLLRQVPERKE